METRRLKLINRQFTLRSRYSKKAINIAEYAWSEFRGPLYRRHWFSKIFEIFCWCVDQALSEKQFSDTEADGVVFCGKCGKVK